MRGKAIQTSLLYLAIGLLLVIILFPFYWVLASSFKSLGEIMRGQPTLLPVDPTLENYERLFWAEVVLKNFQFYLVSSFKVATGTTVVSVILATMGAISLARYQYPGKETLGRMMFFVYMFPGVLLLIPLYRLMTWLHLLDTHWALMFIYTAFAAPFCVWLLRSFFEAVPIELEEAALVDGASRAKAFFLITLPLSAPGIVTASMFAFISAWGEYMFASAIILTDIKKTVPLGLATFMAEQYIEWGRLLAGAVVVTLPVLLLFFPLANYFIRGFMAGAVKY